MTTTTLRIPKPTRPNGTGDSRPSLEALGFRILREEGGSRAGPGVYVVQPPVSGWRVPAASPVGRTKACLVNPGGEVVARICQKIAASGYDVVHYVIFLSEGE